MCSKSLNLGTNPPELQIVGSLIRTFTLVSARSVRFPSLKMPSKPLCSLRFHRIITKEINIKKKDGLSLSKFQFPFFAIHMMLPPHIHLCKKAAVACRKPSVKIIQSR